MTRFVEGDVTVVGALEGLVGVGARMAEALETADERLVGDLLSANWQLQQRLDPGMQTPGMARLERAMADCGSLGGKAAGAGAGGTMFFIIGDDPARAARAAAEQGSTVLPLQWAWEGVRVW
jgi:galactokinase/mevalonate kinase-like predicted kinase